MLIYNYKKNIPEIGGYTCFGITNGGEKDVAVVALEVSSGAPVEIAVLAGGLSITHSDQEITGHIIDSRIGDVPQTSVAVFMNPTMMSPTTVVKTAVIQDGGQTKVLDRGHGVVIPPGASLALRVSTEHVSQVVSATVTFVEAK